MNFSGPYNNRINPSIQVTEKASKFLFAFSIWTVLIWCGSVYSVNAQTYSGGQASYYYSNCSSAYSCTGGGFSGCTNQSGSSPNQYIVAMNSTDMGSVVGCNQCIQITDTNNGNVIVATVIDTCPGCDGLHGPHSIDLDPRAPQPWTPTTSMMGCSPYRGALMRVVPWDPLGHPPIPTLPVHPPPLPLRSPLRRLPRPEVLVGEFPHGPAHQ